MTPNLEILSALREGQSSKDINSLIFSDRAHHLPLTGERAHDLDLVRQAMGTADPQTFRRLFLYASLIDVRDTVPSPTPHDIHVCVGFDDHYAAHGATTMMSAMVSAKPNTTYHFHVFEDPEKPISDHIKSAFDQMMATFDYNHQIHFKTFDMTLMPPTVLEKGMKGHWPRIILFKMYMPELYDDLDRIFWLDSDILVRTDLSEYWTQDFGDQYLMGSRDLDATEHLTRLGLDPTIGYLNAGVVLFNSKKIRGDHASQRIIQLFQDRPNFGDKITAPEQDILAAAYAGKILERDAQAGRGNAFNYFYRENKWTRWNLVHDHFAQLVHIAARSRKPWNHPKFLEHWNTAPQKLDGVHSLYFVMRDLTPWTTHF